LIQFPPFLTWGVLLFSAVVLVELVNVPIELDASVRARDLLTHIGVVTVDESAPLRRVMRAAAMTYVGATLQSILTLMQYVSAAIQRRRGDD
jgi:Zn-dependent membrane protease YugP